MRLAILSLFLCGGMMAYCQSTPSGSARSDKQWKVPSSTSTWMDFDKLPPSRPRNILDSSKTFTLPNAGFLWQRDSAQNGSKMHFQSSQQRTGAAFQTPLLAENVSPLRPSFLSQWPNLKVEPIPTQWFNAKAESIPTQWPNLKMLAITAEPRSPAAP
jgi:hypothetical protein